MTKATPTLLALLSVLPLSGASQAPPVITMDQELHHTLLMTNNRVKVFEIKLAPREAIPMHRHDYDDLSIALGDATTVSTTPGQADVLTISKPGDVSFAPGGWEHSVRNIGQTGYRSILISLLHAQTGARNICGIVVPDQPANCPAGIADLQNQPKFESDQIRIHLHQIGPGQQAVFGEPDRDDLVVTIDEVVAAGAPGKGVRQDQKLDPGSSVWIVRGRVRRVFRNSSDKEARVVTISFKS